MENTSRQYNILGELLEGATDGKYKKVIQNRGGEVEGTTHDERRDLSDTFFGIHEVARKSMGDGTSGVTPNYVPTPPWRLT